MRCRLHLLVFLLITVLLLSACGSVAIPAEEPVENLYERIPDEPYEAVPYSLYPAPEDAYVGDVMPFVTEDDTLEIYYLYDTDHNGQGYHPIYRFTTDDFVGYEDDGMMLEYGLMSDPDPALGTGSVLRDRDGIYHLFYTGHNDMFEPKEAVMHAVSDDMENWEKIPGDTLYAGDDYAKN